jgi:hypothetical protein
LTSFPTSKLQQLIQEVIPTIDYFRNMLELVLTRLVILKER